MSYEKIADLIPQQPQVQYSLTAQLSELRFAANRLGLYDAADFIRDRLEQSQYVERRGPGLRLSEEAQ